MAKKYTVMIFDPEKYGKSKTIFVSKRPFYVVGFIIFLLMVSTIISSYIAYDFYQEARVQQVVVGNDNKAVFNAQLANYIRQLDELHNKVTSLEVLEYKVRELVTYQDSSRVIKQVAVGGKEVDI